MTTLADVRARVRQDLHDEDSTAYVWTDAVLDRHITHAVNDYSVDAPLEQKSTVTTTAGIRDISISSLADLVAVERVEWPTSAPTRRSSSASRCGERRSRSTSSARRPASRTCTCTGRRSTA